MNIHIKPKKNLVLLRQGLYDHVNTLYTNDDGDVLYRVQTELNWTGKYVSFPSWKVLMRLYPLVYDVTNPAI